MVFFPPCLSTSSSKLELVQRETGTSASVEKVALSVPRGQISSGHLAGEDEQQSAAVRPLSNACSPSIHRAYDALCCSTLTHGTMSTFGSGPAPNITMCQQSQYWSGQSLAKSNAVAAELFLRTMASTYLCKPVRLPCAQFTSCLLQPLGRHSLLFALLRVTV